MTTEHQHEAHAQLISLSDAYTDHVADCVAALYTLTERLADDQPYDDPLRRVREFETICDVTNREIGRHLTTFRDDVTAVRDDVGFEDVVSLYRNLDQVANAAEHVATMIDTANPSLSADIADGLRQMMSIAVDVAALLATAVDDYVRALCGRTSCADLRGPVERIRGMESQCDELRDHVVARAFDTLPASTALLCHRLAADIDAIADAAEDVTDRIVYTGGGRSWVNLPRDSADESAPF